MKFKERLEGWSEPLVLFELIPPFADATEAKLHDRAGFVKELLANHPVAAVNVPEVRNESRGGERPSAFRPVMDPRHFAATIRAHIGNGSEFVINHPTVYEPPAAFEAWLTDTVERQAFENLVLVGGESSLPHYAGPSPAEATQRALSRYRKNLVIGGITIPTRRRPGPRDEVERLLSKSEAGMAFFTSQVLYESGSTKLLLRDYAKACLERKVEPRPIFLSLAPIKSAKDLRFLEWLGVEVPAEVRQKVLKAPDGILGRSIEVVTELFLDILAYVGERRLPIPIGLNIEHILAANLEASEDLVEALVALVKAPGAGLPKR